MSIKDPLQRLQVVQTPKVQGWSVSQTCQFYGIAPATFYVWQHRFRTEGLAGLQPRSRRPMSSPTQVGGELEATIVAWRKAHQDWGARRIRDQLRLQGIPPPAISTIHQVLVRHGLITPRPARTITSHRFERAAPNELWQLDATEWELANGTVVQVFDLLDDHSRLLLASRAFPGLSEANAWTVLAEAIVAYGPPRQLLTDNASWLTGRRANAVIEFERHCWRAGIDTIQASPYHPQTLGKLERQHRTLKDWLRRLPRATSLPDLQRQLDPYRHDYNHHRPHQELDGATPAMRYHRGDKATPTGPPPIVTMTRQVAANGTVRYSGWTIHIGRRWIHTAVTLVEHADKLRIMHADELIGIVALDRELHPNRYISTGRPRGRPRTPPQT